MAAIRIGTCSWKYASWKDLVYSAAKGINYLEEYSKAYETVEVDQWFWSLFGDDDVVLPRPDTVAEYRASVPEDFLFTVKAPNALTLTHFYKKKGSEGLKANPHFLSQSLLRDFLKTLDPLRDRLGPIMLQFEYLNRQKMQSMSAFIDMLRAFFEQAPEGYQFALEPRNPQIFRDAYFEFLNELGLSHVFIQGYYMPDIREIYRDHRDLIRGTSVVRLHGYDRQGIEKKTGKKYDSLVEPMDEELPGVIKMVQDMRERGVDVYLNVNNHYEGSSPLTIRKIRKLLEET